MMCEAGKKNALHWKTVHSDHKTIHIYEGAYTPAELSRVQSSPIQGDAAVTLLLTYNGRRGSAYTPAEGVKSSPASLAQPRVLMPHVLLSSVRLQWWGVMEEMDVEKPI